MKLKEKVISDLPTKPTVYIVNLFKLQSMGTPEDKIKYLTEVAEVKQVSEQANLAAFDQQWLVSWLSTNLTLFMLNLPLSTRPNLWTTLSWLWDVNKG